MSSVPRVHWAAFYSDCEHEVKAVTEGHRVTLTYNLYHTPGAGELAGAKTALNVETLPLFQYVKGALKTPTFMPNGESINTNLSVCSLIWLIGGNLGIYCQHAYAHTNSDVARQFPGILKGSDMAVYDVFRALGLKLDTRAILDGNARDEEEDDEYGDEDYPREYQHRYNTIAGRLGRLRFTELGGDEESQREVIEGWGGEHMDVTWVNAPRSSSIDMVHMTVCIDLHGCLNVMVLTWLVWKPGGHWRAVLKRRYHRSSTACGGAKQPWHDG